jgi:hypothetical protein
MDKKTSRMGIFSAGNRLKPDRKNIALLCALGNAPVKVAAIGYSMNANPD